MSGRIVLTIGTGKTGTHTLHEALTAAGVYSLHEPDPLLAAESVLYYQGLIGKEDVPRLHEFGRFCGMLREAAEKHPVVHVVCHRATPLALHLVRELNADLIWLHRADFEACVASWIVHGAHKHHPLFIQPRKHRERFQSMSQVGRVAWYVRQTERIARIRRWRASTEDGRWCLDLETGDLGSTKCAEQLAKFFGNVNSVVLERGLTNRRNATATEKTKLAMRFMLEKSHELEAVKNGDLDEDSFAS